MRTTTFLSDGGDWFPADYPKQFDEDRVEIVRRIYAALECDYGAKFMSQFRSGPKPFVWKCRLLDLARPYTNEIVLDAVDRACASSPDMPPTLRVLEAEMRMLAQEIERRRKADDDARRRREEENKDPEGLARIRRAREQAAAFKLMPRTLEEQIADCRMLAGVNQTAARKLKDLLKQRDQQSAQGGTAR